MEVHRELGGGFIEAVYEEALCHELTVRKIRHERQYKMPVFYKGLQMGGRYSADIMVEDEIIVEVKAVSALIDRHVAQALHYLAGTRKRLALLINFGPHSLETRRVVR